MYDLIIKNGTLIDGTGAPRFKADIAVSDGIIVKIAPNLEGEAKRVLDAGGLIVSPGFIDTHTHSDSSILAPNVTGYNHLEDGATTEIAGQCGTFVAPYYGEYTPNPYITEEKLAEIAKSYASYFEYAESLSLGTNLAFFAGQGGIRGKVMGLGEGEPNEAQIAEMKALMAEAMECGCLGFSTGLVYTPSVFAGTNELIEIAKTAHEYGGIYTTHIRGEGNTLKESIEEALVIGRASGIPVNISHIKVQGHHNEGNSHDIIKYIEENQKAGMVITADQYPFLGGSAPLVSQIPPKYLTKGKLEGVIALRDPELRAKALWSIFNEAEEFESNLYSAGFEGTLIAGAYKTQEYVGKTIAQIAEEEGKEPFDVTLELLEKNEGVVQGIYFSQNQSDLINFLKQPWVMAGSDWSDYNEPIDPEKQGGGHPRGTATMVRRLELIRDNNLMPLEEAIYRMTGMPADFYGLNTIGKLREGMAADITIFDYDKIKANADYEKPFRKNEGIHYVIVNGGFAVEGGVFTGLKNGHVLKKAK